MTDLAKFKTWDEVPETLKTKTSLGKLGLKLAKGQQPAGVKLASRASKIDDVYLYDTTQAVPKRKPTQAELDRLAEGRRKAMTTTCCNRFVGVINWREHGNLCWHCWELEQERRHQEMLTEARHEAAEWARGVLADDQAVILDTETTGLSSPEIIEIAVIHATTGDVLFNRRLNPISEIEPGAQAVHGISKADLENEPRFSEVYEELRQVLQGARVVIYNASFDVGALGCTRRLHGDLEPIDFEAECAMTWYAAWYGEWSNYWKSFKWKPLAGGDHSALGDCRSALDCIRYMAEDKTDG